MTFNTSLFSTKIPRSVEKALKDKKWKKVIEEEFSALRNNETLEKYVSSISIRKENCGTVERYKARLVANGHTQKYEIYYSESKD